MRLPEYFSCWDEVAGALPNLLAAGRARSTIEQLPVLDPAHLADRAQLERAMGVLSVLGHAAFHENSALRLGRPESVSDAGGGSSSSRAGSATTIPRSVAVPWCRIARQLERPPVLSYASHALNNWRRIDEDGPIALGNTALLRNFFGGLDENWFVLVHVEIEAHAAPLVRAAIESQSAIAAGRTDELVVLLEKIGDAQERIYNTLLRMRTHCDPVIFFNRVQPFLHGLRDVVYEGVEAFGGQPQTFAGASGAQSAVLPLIDAVLGVAHDPDALLVYLQELRTYMPIEHRALLHEIESRPSIRDYILARREPMLVEHYNRSLRLLECFRSSHFEMSVSYIKRPAEAQASDRGERGTGGSPFMSYLTKHLRETVAHRIV